MKQAVMAFPYAVTACVFESNMERNEEGMED